MTARPEEEPSALTAEQEDRLAADLAKLAGIRLSEEEEAYQADHQADDQDKESGNKPDSPAKETPIQGRGGKVDMERLLCDLLGALGISVQHSNNEAEFKQNLYAAAMQAIKERTGQGAPGQGTPPAKVNPLIQAAAPNVNEESPPMYMSMDTPLSPEAEAAVVEELARLMGARPEGTSRDEDDRLADLLIPQR